MREFFDGARMLGSGLAFWRRIPGPMTLGLVPAAIVGIVLFCSFFGEDRRDCFTILLAHENV